MENFVLSPLEPKGVFRFVEELARIPHGSGNTAAASAWAMDFARTRGLRCRQDELGSVVIWKPASPGYEGHPAVVLQGHLDMVCVKDAGTAHDFEKDPLDLVVEGDWVRARGTTLGGDNGIAVAIILALLDDETAVHPPIEAVLTVDEEIGLLGANGLDCSDLAGRKLINIDSEDEGVLTVSCAGGSRCDIRQEFPLEEAEGAVCTLTVSGGEEGAVLRAAAQLREAMRAGTSYPTAANMAVEILGPAPAPVVKVNNRYRYRIFWIGRNDHTTRELIAYYIRAFHQKKENRGMNLFVDCNGEE